MRRIGLTAIVFVVSAALATAALRRVVIQHIEQRLNTAGLTWESRQSKLFDTHWNTLSGTGIEAKRLTIRGGWPILAELSTGTIDLAVLAKKQPSPASAAQTTTTKKQDSWKPNWQLSCTDITIKWDGEPLLSRLNGQAYPELQLKNEATQVSGKWRPRTNTILNGSIEGDLPHPSLHGRGTLSFSLGDPVRFELESTNAQIQHAFLAKQRLPKTTLTAEGVWSPKTGEAAIDGQFGGVSWSGIGKAKSGSIDMKFRVALTPLQEIVALFGDGIPEAARTKISGELSLDGRIEGPPWAWTVEPGAKGLSAAGAVPVNYLGPIIRWNTPGRTKTKRCTTPPGHPNKEPICTVEYEQIPHITGPRTPEWIAMDRAGWMPKAVIAAEDIRFRSHEGFDLVAIQEALANAHSDERIRGGSTITQQLAKNLFLDGRRTLQRKLRELILAMSLEERMTKDAILTLYLNVVEFGPGIWGIHDAAEAWFLKSPDQLTVRESAFLASILPAPNMWHKRISESGRVPISRVNGVLDRMRRRGSIGQSKYRRARSETLRVVPPSGAR